MGILQGGSHAVDPNIQYLSISYVYLTYIILPILKWYGFTWWKSNQWTFGFKVPIIKPLGKVRCPKTMWNSPFLEWLHIWNSSFGMVKILKRKEHLIQNHSKIKPGSFDHFFFLKEVDPLTSTHVFVKLLPGQKNRRANNSEITAICQLSMASFRTSKSNERAAKRIKIRQVGLVG